MVIIFGAGDGASANDVDADCALAGTITLGAEAGETEGDSFDWSIPDETRNPAGCLISSSNGSLSLSER